MAAQTVPLVPVEEYLSESYEPDVEYIEGELVARNMGTPAHSLLQLIVGAYLLQSRGKLRYGVMTEPRTAIANLRYRIPDVLVVPLPIPKGKVIDTVPLAVIEILSLEDRLSDQIARFRDYAGLGVANIVLMDPEERVAYTYHHEALTEVKLTSLSFDIPGTGAVTVPFTTDELFAQLEAELSAE